MAETWSDAFSYDIPFSDSKIYAGTLSDGRNYIIGNWYPGREKTCTRILKTQRK